jgi:hypothetical protein
MERSQRTFEELIGIIELQKQALLYYSEEKNYKGDNPNILNDNGYQARFVLETQIKQDKYHNDVMKEAEEILNQYDKENDDDVILSKLGSISNLINSFKNKKNYEFRN